MSQEMMDPELFADFIVEAREHLETIEPNLLELEKAPDNLALLNDIFRPMHSLKGASGFLGLNRINKLAHRAENILDALRKGSMVVTSEIMDVILSSTDALRQMIDNLDASSTEGDVEVDHLVNQIDSIMDGGSAAPAPAPADTSAHEAAPEAEVSVPQESNVIEETPPPAPPAEVSDAMATPDASNNSGAEDTPPMSTKEWVASLPSGEPYQLTAYGEDHLKDFIDEAGEIIENLNAGLLGLEEDPTGQEGLVKDIFRYFHNLKGNSGIVGYQELTGLTHEAETLLNKVREHEITPSHELIDLLLLVVDMMEALVQRIDIPSVQATGFDTSLVINKLKQANSGGKIELPEELLAAQGRGSSEGDDAGKDGQVSAPACIPVGTEQSDSDAFDQTIKQQMAIIQSALENLSKDGTLKDSIDNLYRSLTVVRNACAAVGQDEIKVYAERTAGIVDQGRKSDLDFSMMVDMMSQEVGIIDEMIQKAIAEGKISISTNAPQAPESKQPTVAAPAPKAPQEVAPAKGETKPAAQSAPASAPAPATPAQKPQAPKIEAPKPAAAKPAASPAPAAQPAKAAAAAPAANKEHKGSSTIRVDQWRLDHLMNSIGELIINRNRYTLIARSLENASENINIAEVAQDLSETTYAMARISDDLQDTIMKVRMVPVSSVFSRFPRLVRDLSRKSGKEVDLIMEGEETELDKSVVEVIGDPLVHLIRNSVDHGIEPEADRIAAGKPAKGKVTLRAFHKGNSVAIEVEDDGKGIDPEKMREVAVKKGIISQEEAAQLDDREARELIFAPGFSSAEKITDISGRGVGMDVVRTNIKNLKGSVNTNSEIGKGTKFTLSLPLTLAIIDALMVNVQGQMYAIPLDAVAETTKIESKRLTDVKGRKAVTLRGDVLGIVELSEMLGLPAAETLPEMLSVVVIHDNDRRLGLVVDQLLERQEIVIKPLGAYLGDLQGISGATIMGDGSVILILDPHEIYLLSTSKASSSSENTKQQTPSASSGKQ